MEIVLCKNIVNALGLDLTKLKECTNTEVFTSRLIETRKGEYILLEHYATGLVVILNLQSFIRYGVYEIKNLFGQVLQDIGIPRDTSFTFLEVLGDVEYVLPNSDFTEQILQKDNFQIDFEYFMSDLGNKKLIQSEASKYLNVLSDGHLFGVRALVINHVKTRLKV